MEGLKQDYGKSTVTMDSAPFETYFRIATYRFDSESTENLLAAMECFKSPESSKLCFLILERAFEFSLLEFSLLFEILSKVLIFFLKPLFFFYSPSSASHSILICGPDFKATVNQAYFNIKLRQLFESMFSSIHSYDLIEQQATFIRSVALCTKSSLAFQYFYTRTEQMMTAHAYAKEIQSYLDRVLFDIRLGVDTIDDFCQMYEPALYFHVKMLTDFQYGRCNSSNDAAGEVIRALLINLRCKDSRRFVILVTHFDAFRYLLDEALADDGTFVN